MAFHYFRGGLALVLIGVVGCATVPADHGAADVREQVTLRGVPFVDAVGADRAALMEEIFAKPLMPDGAMRIAFVNNPRMQGVLAQLGFSAAEVLQAGRLSNPTLSASQQSSSRSNDASRYDLGITQNFSELLLLGARTRFQKGEFERAKLDATQRLLELAADVSTAYYTAVGAQQIVQMRATVATAASASAELAARFARRREFAGIATRDRASSRQSGATRSRAGSCRGGPRGGGAQ